MRVLVAGFGPFPGAPKNPSGDLVRALARIRRPGLADVEIHSIVLPTIYAAVTRELPRLLDTLQPDAVLLFGLAGGDRLRVETRGVNAASILHPDAARALPVTRVIAAEAPHERFVAPVMRRLIGAARSAGVKARISRDAGRYLCNAGLYLCLDPTRQKPPLVTFIHIPPPAARRTRRSVRCKQPSMAALLRTGEAILCALVAEARRPRA